MANLKQFLYKLNDEPPKIYLRESEWDELIEHIVNKNIDGFINMCIFLKTDNIFDMNTSKFPTDFKNLLIIGRDFSQSLLVINAHIKYEIHLLNIKNGDFCIKATMIGHLDKRDAYGIFHQSYNTNKNEQDRYNSFW